MADLDGTGLGFPWQNIANLLFGFLISLGGYLWKQTAETLAAEKNRNEKQDVEIAKLQEWRIAEERRNQDLGDRLKRMEEKLDQILYAKRIGANPCRNRIGGI